MLATFEKQTGLFSDQFLSKIPQFSIQETQKKDWRYKFYPPQFFIGFNKNTIDIHNKDQNIAKDHHYD